MSDLILNAFTWPTLAIAVLVFGFAPGVALRVIVLAFRDDLRRKELLAELHTVPRLERPFWVAEQLEVASLRVCATVSLRGVANRSLRLIKMISQLLPPMLRNPLQVP
jgi:hypothetical protein